LAHQINRSEIERDYLGSSSRVRSSGRPAHQGEGTVEAVGERTKSCGSSGGTLIKSGCSGDVNQRPSKSRNSA
jgi:hypothetical protein